MSNNMEVYLRPLVSCRLYMAIIKQKKDFQPDDCRVKRA